MHNMHEGFYLLSPRKKRGTPPADTGRRAPPAAGVIDVGIAPAALQRWEAPFIARTLHPGEKAAPSPSGLVRTHAGPAGRWVGSSPGRPAGRVRRGRVLRIGQARDAIAGDGHRRGRVGECLFSLAVASTGTIFGSSGISPRLVRTEGRRGHVGTTTATASNFLSR